MATRTNRDDEDDFGGEYNGTRSKISGTKRSFGDLEDDEDDIFGSKKGNSKVEETAPGVATGMILSLRESLETCKDTLATCQRELEVAKSEIQKWHSAFQNEPYIPAGTSPDTGVVCNYLQTLKSSEESLREQLDKAKKKEAAFIVTFAKREQEIAAFIVTFAKREQEIAALKPEGGPMNWKDMYLSLGANMPDATRVVEDYEKLLDEKYPEEVQRPSFDQELWEKASIVKKDYVKGIGLKRSRPTSFTCSSGSSSSFTATSANPSSHLTAQDLVRAICEDQSLLAQLWERIVSTLGPEEIAVGVASAAQ